MIICYARCWACQFGQCFEPPQVHTWMDREDAEHAGVAWPMSPDQQAERRCACSCARPDGAER